MQSDTKAHWETIYQDKSPREVSWFQQRPLLSLRLIQRSKAGLSDHIIDVGGGASMLVDCLLDAGYQNVAVLDISSHALASTQARLKDRAHQVTWYEQDILQFSPQQTFSVWHDRAVFHFLTGKADREKYIDTVKSVLDPGGQIIIAAFALDGPTHCSGLEIVQYDAEKLNRELGEAFELIEEERETHFTPTDKAQRFGYYRFKLG